MIGVRWGARGEGGRGGEGEGNGGGWVPEKAPWLAGCQKAKKAHFGLQNDFLAPKMIFGAKSAFWRKKAENGLQKRKKVKNGAQNTKETIV